MMKLAVIVVCGILSLSALAHADDAQSLAPGSEAITKQQLPADRVFALERETSPFLVMKGEDEGQRVTMTVRPEADSQHRWVISFTNMFRLTVIRSDEGAVEVVQMELLDRNDRIRFTPGFELVPAHIQANRHLEMRGTATVHDLKDDEKKYSGTYTHRIQNVSNAEFDVPARSIDGHLIEYRFRVDFGVTSIDIDLETGWSHAANLIYWRSKRTVETIGLFGETSFRVLALAEENQSSPR